MTNAAPSYAVREYTVAPGDSVQVYRQSTFLTCLAGNIPFKVAFDGNSASEFQTGLTYREAQGFNLIEVINQSDTTALQVKLAFGKGDVSDSRLALTGTVVTEETAAPVFNTSAPVSAANGAITFLAGPNGNRSEIMIANDGAGKVYIAGNAGAGAGEGIPLNAGGVMVLTTQAALWVRNDSGAAVAVAVAELERV